MSLNGPARKRPASSTASTISFERFASSTTSRIVATRIAAITRATRFTIRAMPQAPLRAATVAVPGPVLPLRAILAMGGWLPAAMNSNPK